MPCTPIPIGASRNSEGAASNDGPAAVFRLVINVAGVSGANTSGGLGSVYFPTGSAGAGDIKIADLTFEVGHKYADTASTITARMFYATNGSRPRRPNHTGTLICPAAWIHGAMGVARAADFRSLRRR